ncbi:hypothetical protein PILCRDRAFT_92913 [Piloderma croceum F 1598]|uniref:Uncharacterized protein n=1 Tax=Piloderma croceum (strain F 1598) TaxID=765440 RepID=A0A0C3F0N9_PILCF|nr:hypothetical protein PILCRDRAFT_92913 [Piloderma croceum F 1598]
MAAMHENNGFKGIDFMEIPALRRGVSATVVARQYSLLAASQERWDRMSILFESIKMHVKTYEYLGLSMDALEKSPVGGGGPPLPETALPNGHANTNMTLNRAEEDANREDEDENEMLVCQILTHGLELIPNR